MPPEPVATGSPAAGAGHSPPLPPPGSRTRVLRPIRATPESIRPLWCAARGRKPPGGVPPATPLVLARIARPVPAAAIAGSADAVRAAKARTAGWVAPARDRPKPRMQGTRAPARVKPPGRRGPARDPPTRPVRLGRSAVQAAGCPAVTRAARSAAVSPAVGFAFREVPAMALPRRPALSMSPVRGVRSRRECQAGRQRGLKCLSLRHPRGLVPRQAGLGGPLPQRLARTSPPDVPRPAGRAGWLRRRQPQQRFQPLRYRWLRTFLRGQGVFLARTPHPRCGRSLGKWRRS